MKATQGVILVMLGTLILYLVWSKRSPLSGNAAVDQIVTAEDNAKKIAEAAAASKSKTGPTGDPNHSTVRVHAGGLTYVIDAVTQGIIEWTDDATGRTYKGAP